MLKTILYSLLFVSSLVVAEEAITPYLASECDTLSLIEGVVNACNGKLVQVDRDIVIQGSDPLELVRHYDGGHDYEKGYGYGVGLGYPLQLIFDTDIDTIYIDYRMGAKITCEVKKVKKHREKRYKGTVSDSFLKLGYMNNCEAQLMGEPSLAALEVEGTEKGFVVTLGNGTKRHYDPYYQSPLNKSYYRLTYEERPNGNRRYFHYTREGSLELNNVRTTNPAGNLVFNRIDFYHGKNQVAAKGSNGQEVHYQIVQKKGFSLLKKVSGNHIPETDYQSVFHKHDTGARFSLEKVSTPDGRHLEVDYKFLGDDHSVKKLSISGEEETLYNFIYYDHHHTGVKNAFGAEKEFTFSKRRLSRVKEEHKRTEYTWDKKGQLREQEIKSPDGTTICRKEFDYDQRGNIICAKIFASITKQFHEDRHIIQYTYSDDGRNLLLKENYNDRKEFHYSYRPNTNLIEDKLTLFDKKILEREFHRYDGNSILVCKIVDDGSHPDCDNLQDVTYRKITQIEPQINPHLPGLTLPRQITEWYQDSAGQQHLLTRKERTYTLGDLLAEEKVFDSANIHRYTLVWEYNDKRQLVSETNALGEKTLYRYDANDNQIYEEKVGTGKKVHYIYDAANRLVGEIEEHPDKTLATKHTYDVMGNKISSIDHFGQVTTFKYDKQSREIAKIDPLGYTEYKQYDALDNVSKAIDKDGFATITKYNLYGSPFKIVYTDGSEKIFEYNLFGHLVKETNRDGSWVVHEVDYQGRPIITSTFAKDGTCLKTTQKTYKGSNLVAEIDAMFRGTYYQYDGAGRQIAKIEGSIITRYSYDALGRLFKTIKGDRVDIKEYDLLDRVIEERTEDFAGTIYSKVQYAYDIHGNRQTKREYADSQNYSETITFYNSENLPIKEIDACGNETRIFYHRTDHLEKEIIDPLGHRTIEVYDPLNHLQELKIISPLGVLQAHTSFTYDGRGNKTHQQEEIIRNGTSIGTFVIDIAYDGMGQKTAETEQGCKTTTFTYEFDRLQAIQKPDGVTLMHVYDSLGRLVHFYSSDGTIYYVYIYDLNDNLLNAKDCLSGAATCRAYDYLNRLIAETLSNGLCVAYSYDEKSRVKEFVFLDSKIVYDYSPTQLTRATRYQNNEPLYSYTQTPNWRGKPIQATLLNQASLTYVWDKLGRCAQIQSETYNQTLSYDALSNLSRTAVQDSIGAYDAVFQYDDLNQLTQENGHCSNTYNYDSIHNIHHKNQTPRTIDPLNRLTHDGVYSYTYDPCGRRITKGNENYRYDALGRLLSYTNGDISVSYQYDSFGRRVKCSTPTSTSSYFYQFDTEVGRYDGALKEFRMIQGKHAPVSIELDGAVYSPIRNHRGDICQLLNSNQVPVATYRYDAFGLPTHAGSVHSPWLFSGQRYDQHTSLYHYDKREYDPNTGRWLTPDPLGFVDGPNLYAYVQNNPLMYVDPYGLWFEWVGGCVHGVRELCHGFGRGFVDDTSFGATSYAMGSYRSQMLSGSIGYGIGTCVSVAAGCCYGGTYLKLVRAAYLGSRALKGSVTAVKTLRETCNIVKVVREATPTVSKVSQTAKRHFLKTEGVKNVNKVDSVIRETLEGSVLSKHRVSANEALECGFKFLGQNYKELGKPNSGVFRSSDGLRGFRIDNNSLKGAHDPHTPHFHLEVYKPGADKPYINNHIPFYD